LDRNQSALTVCFVVAALAALSCTRRPPRAQRCEVGTDVRRATTRNAIALDVGARFVREVPDTAFPACARFSASAEPGHWTLRLVAHAEPPPTEPWSRMLSGLFWNRSDGRFWSVQDNDPHLVHLEPDDALEQWHGEFVAADFGRHHGIEAVAMLGGRWLFTDDGHGDPLTAHLFAMDALGRPSEVPWTVPEEVSRVSENSGFEALAVAPDESAVVVAQERPGIVQGQCCSQPFLARLTSSGSAEIYRYPLEHDSSGQDVGLSDVAAVAGRRLITMERGYTRGVGSAVRIYVTDLGAPGTVLAPGPVSKTLLLDIVDLPASAFANGLGYGQTAHPALGNYEGLALGPCLTTGERSIVLLTDDNADTDRSHGGQPRHIVVLGVSDR
jgi:hypothetical protein